ncbi:hypothetical protein DFI02_1151 [Rhizobium sp. PP-F2F-G20b]|nr:hypothetical protein DFI02_1151 [Rhizobium sp. PP-F2F-G20b]
MSIIQDHWRQLVGNVHRADETAFEAAPQHTFNLSFPPPAFTGNLDAPIVVLTSNGGYKAGKTEAEFPNDEAIAEYRAYLKSEVNRLPTHLSSYYSAGPFSKMIEDGSVVLVNAVPYRSPQLSREPENRKVALRLGSLAVHRKWLLEELLPQARSGNRFVFAHRNGWWGVPS